MTFYLVSKVLNVVLPFDKMCTVFDVEVAKLTDI